MRSVCVCVCVSLSLFCLVRCKDRWLAMLMFFCAYHFPRLLCLVLPLSCYMASIRIFFAILTSTFLVCACIFCIFVLHCFAVCFCTCFFAFLHFVCSFHLFFVALCFCPCIFFAFFVCFFALCFCPCIFLQCSFAFFITCCIFSRLQFSRIAHKPPTQS